MSRMPYSPNKLSPWPRVLFRDSIVDADGFSGGEVEPRSNAGSHHCDRYPTLVLRSRMEPVSKTSTVDNQSTQGRRSSFGSTQQQMTVAGNPIVRPLDREVSGRRVQRLLKLRKQRLREATENGDGAEIYRLKHLNLFENIEKPTTERDICGHGILEVSPSESDVIYEMATPITAPNVGLPVSSLPFAPDHTSEFREHMMLQQAGGVVVPTDYASHTVHSEPALRIAASTEPSTNLARSTTSHKSFKSATKKSSPARRGASTSQSSVIESFRSRLAAKGSAPRSETILDEDSFLFIADCIRHRSATFCQHRRRQRQRQSSVVTGAKSRENAGPRCSCSGHRCRTYLSGTSSQHCSNCKLPELQPEIKAAIERIHEVEASAMFASDVGMSMRNTGVDFGLPDIRQDMALVNLYNTEMEKRCSKGVWWEGWLVVEDLKRQGFVGSK